VDVTAARWRELMIATMEPVKHDALLLSGGTDSATMLAALLEIGVRPTCFGFTLSGSESRDVQVARSMANAFGLEFHVSVIDRGSLRTGVDRLARIIKPPRRKAHMQCSHPIMHMASDAAARGFKQILVGTGGVVKDNRKCSVILHQEGEAAARTYRRSELWKDTDSSHSMRAVAVAHGCSMFEPYKQTDFAEYGLSLDVAEINRPHQKGVAFRAFPEFWKKGRWRRQNGPLQIVSGVREWHDTLLRDPKLNPGGRFKAVVAIYNRL
jgi:hypothetical protein